MVTWNCTASLLIQFVAQKNFEKRFKQVVWRFWKLHWGEKKKSILYHHIRLNLIMKRALRLIGGLTFCQRRTVRLWRQHTPTQICPQVGQMLFVNHDLWKIKQFKSGQNHQSARQEITEALNKNIWRTLLLSSPVTRVYLLSSFIAQIPLLSSFPPTHPSLLSLSPHRACQRARSVFH